jgi:hypothetical protein
MGSEASTAQQAICDTCGEVYAIGDWPFCPHGRPAQGATGAFVEYWDEHVAPPPSEYFKPVGSLPEYHPDLGYRITSLGDRKRLMRLNKMDYRGRKVGGSRCEF